MLVTLAVVFTPSAVTLGPYVPVSVPAIPNFACGATTYSGGLTLFQVSVSVAVCNLYITRSRLIPVAKLQAGADPIHQG